MNILILRILANALVILFLVIGLRPAVAQSQGMDDPLYDLQWHLNNTGQFFGIPGEDINVEPVWEKTLNDGLTKIRGQGTYIAIVDDDLPFNPHSAIPQTRAHPDLIANISTQHSVDYYPSVIDTSRHATAVAGIAAARGYNDMGVRGVAPEAKIYGLNILGIPSGNRSISRNTRDLAVFDAMVRHRTITAVSNNSWGSPSSFSPSGSTLRAWEMAIETGIRDGFHGKGMVYIWAAGNDRCAGGVCDITNSNYDGFTKHYATVPICAVGNRGEHASFSQLGANLWVCAPSRGTKFFVIPRPGQTTLIDRSPGIVTTSRGTSSGLYAHDLYTNTFSGTSAATPIVSGVVALMRQVNPSLSWRDVKLILANSARQNHPTDDGWMQGAIKYGLSSDDDSAQYHFNHKYGFGVVDAEKAVEMAEEWINLPPAAPYTEVRNSNLNLRLSADNPVINSEISVQSDINFIEYVEIPIRFAHPLIQDLSVKLTSPSGTTSNLFIPSTDSLSGTRYARNVRGIWTFGSSVHLGEDPSGVWRLRFEDARSTTGTFSEWGVRIRGYQIKMDAASAVGLSDNNVTVNPLTLSLIGASWEKDLQPNDFGLPNAPAGLRIADVSRTSDTQVQLHLALDSGFARDYLFQVIAMTSAVPNIRNPVISNDIPIVSEKAPMLEIISLPKQTIQQGSTTHVVVSVSDENFDVNDRVVVTARSSSQTIVSVTTSEQTNNITTHTRITFVLTAEQGGMARVTFTATDNYGLSDSETVLLRVNAPPMITSFDNIILVQEGREQTIAVLVSDGNTDDGLTLSLTAMDESQDIVELVTTNAVVMTNGNVSREEQTLTIKGLKAGTTTLNITISDEHTESAPVPVSVTVEENIAPTISSIPTQPIRLLDGAETLLNVTIDDADADDTPADLMLSIKSDDPDVVSVTEEGNDATRTIRITGEEAGITTITVTVNDRRGASNSVVSAQFEVEVEAHTAPTIMAAPSIVPTMQLNSTANVVVSVSDENFDVNDRVVVTARSSSQTIVSVTTSEQTNNITTHTRITYVLTAEQGGMARVTFTATDNHGLSDSETMLLRVNAPPTITSFDNIVSVQEGREQTIAVLVSDGNTDDGLTLSLTASDESQDIVELVTTNVVVMTSGNVSREEQTLTIKGLKAGTTTLNITISDEHTESAPIPVLVTVEENIAPTISSVPIQPVRLLDGAETLLNVTIDDADADDTPADLMLSIKSDDPDVVSVTEEGNDATRTIRITGEEAGITTITVMVNDRRSATNSVVSAQFEVEVEAHTAPTIMVIPSIVPTMQLHGTTNVVVSVSDENFDVNDRVVVTAKSSSQTIVSVTTSEQTNNITTSTHITFVLTAEQSGTATIKFFATDSGRLSDSETVSVRVNAPPTISGVPTQPIRLLDGAEIMLNVTVDDADADDSLTLLLTAIDESQDIVELVTTGVVVTNNGSATREAQNLKIKGLKAGTTELNITVNDEYTESALVPVSIVVEGNIAPTITTKPSIVPKMRLHSTTNVVVSVLDKNFDVNDKVVVTVRSSSQTIVSVTTSEQTNSITTDTRIIFILTAEQSGTATIKFFATDSQGLSDSETVPVRVNTPPRVPTPPEPIVVLVGEPYTLEIGDTGIFKDADDDTLTYSRDSDARAPDNLVLNPNGRLTFTPGNASTSTAGFTVIVSADDGNGGMAQTTFTFLINAKPSGSVSIRRNEKDRWLLSSTSTIVDKNGIATTGYQWYRNDMPIESRATSSTYKIPSSNIGRAAETSYRLEVTIMDNIEQSVTTQSNTITIANEAPVIESIPAPQINEDATQDISIRVSDANHDDLRYSWSTRDRKDSEVLSNANQNPATLTISPNFVDATSNREIVNLEVTVSDEVASTAAIVPVEVIKINNGEATLGISVIVVRTEESSATTLTAMILSDDPDRGTSGTVTYQWQVCAGSRGRCPPENGWKNIKEATSTQYIISGLSIMLKDDSNFFLVEDNSLFRIRADYEDGQGYDEEVYSSRRVYTTRPAVRIRAKVFLEGLLQ